MEFDGLTRVGAGGQEKGEKKAARFWRTRECVPRKRAKNEVMVPTPYSLRASVKKSSQSI